MIITIIIMFWKEAVSKETLNKLASLFKYLQVLMYAQIADKRKLNVNAGFSLRKMYAYFLKRVRPLGPPIIDE